MMCIDSVLLVCRFTPGEGLGRRERPKAQQPSGPSAMEMAKIRVRTCGIICNCLTNILLLYYRQPLLVLKAWKKFSNLSLC